MRTIYKYTLQEERTKLNLPKMAWVLDIHGQNNQVHMWVEIESTEEVLDEREFLVIATGMPIPEDAFYLGTAFLLNGNVVFHVFEIIDERVE